MKRQLIFFGLASLVMAYFMKDAPAEFLDLWVDLRAAGKVSAEDYDSAWARFILPQIALYLLIVTTVLIMLSDVTGKSRRSAP